MSLSKTATYLTALDECYSKFANAPDYTVVREKMILTRSEVNDSFSDIESKISNLSFAEGVTILNDSNRMQIEINPDEDEDTLKSEASHFRYALIMPLKVKDCFQRAECPFEFDSHRISTDEGDVARITEMMEQCEIITTPCATEGSYITIANYKNSYVFKGETKTPKYNSALIYKWFFKTPASKEADFNASDIVISSVIVTGGRRAGHSNLVGWVEKYMQGDKALMAGSQEQFAKILRCENGVKAQELGGPRGGMAIPDGFFDKWSQVSIKALVRADMTRLRVPAFRMWLEALADLESTTKCKILFVEVTGDGEELEWGCGYKGDTMVRELVEGKSFNDFEAKLGLAQPELATKAVKDVNWVFDKKKAEAGSPDVVVNKSGVSKHVLFNLYKQLRVFPVFPSDLFDWKALYVVKGPEDEESPRKRAKSVESNSQEY